MTQQPTGHLNISKEDIALLAGVGIAVYGVVTGSTTLTAIGLAIGGGGKALGSVFSS